MPTRFFTHFRTVDFFGKSIPGTVAALLTLSILPLPINILRPSGEPVTLRGVTTLLILVLGVLIVSFVIGQALDTVAVVVERVLYGLGNAIWRIYISIPYAPRREQFTRIDSMSEEEIENLNVILQIILEFSDWVYNRFNSMRHVFKPHRSLFGEHIEDEMANEEGDSMDMNQRYNVFLDSFREHTDIDPDKADMQTLYIYALSTLERAPYNRANRFQINFMFCRGIWVTLFVFSVIWAVLSIDYLTLVSTLLNSVAQEISQLPYIAKLPELGINPANAFGIDGDGLIQSQPLILRYESVSPGDLRFLSALLLAFSMVFMYASVEYKKHYLEYVITDFTNAIKEQVGDKGSSDRSPFRYYQDND